MNAHTPSRWYWRWLRRALIALAVLATIIAALVTEENVRGKHKWDGYKQAAAVRGEPLDWAAFFPTPLPDDENFAKAPIFSKVPVEASGQKVDDPLKMYPERTDGSSPKDTGGSWELGRLTSLESWQKYYREGATKRDNEFSVPAQPQSPAADVLLALGKFDAALDDLRAASQRPYSRIGGYSVSDPTGFPVMMTYLMRFKGCAQVLRLRAVAELADQRQTNALDDVCLLLALSDKLRQEPLIISSLVNLAIETIALDPIYEGLAQHQWNDAQLATLEQRLAARDCLADFQYARKGELIFAVDHIENQRVTHMDVEAVSDKNNVATFNTNNLAGMPSAFFYQEELSFARMSDQYLAPLVDVTNHLVSPAVYRRMDQTAHERQKHYSPYTVQAWMVFPAVSRSAVKCAVAQANIDMARVACALERYWLAHGEYPATLESLAPQSIQQLPHDLINGQPLHYRRTDDGRFVLYSVGWNEQDDGGMVATNRNGTLDREKRGDWVWRYPAK